MTAPAPAATPTAARPLFGGAIAFAVPQGYRDASDFRQVPDTQEVFVADQSDTSVIVEILESVDEGDAATDLNAAARFHFDALAHDNAALSSEILTPPQPPAAPQLLTASSVAQLPTPNPVIVTGIQTIHKFSHDPSGAPRPGHEGDAPDRVWIGVALWRCWADLPGAVKKRADVVGSVNVNLSAEGGEAEQRAVEAWWRQSVASMRVLDWGLFGDQ